MGRRRPLVAAVGALCFATQLFGCEQPTLWPTAEPLQDDDNHETEAKTGPETLADREAPPSTLADRGHEPIHRTLLGISRLAVEMRPERLKALTAKIRDAGKPLDARDVGSVLFCLNGLGDSEELREFLKALTPLVAACAEPLDAEYVGLALFGLVGLGESEEVRALLKALTPRIAECPEPLKARHVGKALFGLQRLGDSDEARALLVALTPRVQACSEPLRARQVGNALYGLQGFGDSEEVRALLKALTPKVEACRWLLHAQDVGNALFGLHRLGDSDELRALLVALTPKVQACPEPLPAQQVGCALFGFQRLGDSKEVRCLLVELASKVDVRELLGSLTRKACEEGLGGLQEPYINRTLCVLQGPDGSAASTFPWPAQWIHEFQWLLQKARVMRHRARVEAIQEAASTLIGVPLSFSPENLATVIDQYGHQPAAATSNAPDLFKSSDALKEEVLHLLDVLRLRRGAAAVAAAVSAASAGTGSFPPTRRPTRRSGPSA